MTFPAKALFPPLFCAAFLLAGALQAAEKVPDPSAKDRIWAVMKPLQCLGNPWEKDWLLHHKNRASRYPIHRESDIIKSFFRKEGIAVYALRVRPFQGGVPCTTCGCERGDTLYALVNATNSIRMNGFGFTKRLPYEGNAR